MHIFCIACKSLKRWATWIGYTWKVAITTESYYSSHINFWVGFSNKLIKFYLYSLWKSPFQQFRYKLILFLIIYFLLESFYLMSLFYITIIVEKFYLYFYIFVILVRIYFIWTKACTYNMLYDSVCSKTKLIMYSSKHPSPCHLVHLIENCDWKVTLPMNLT